MTTDFNRLNDYLDYLVERYDESAWKTRLRPKKGKLKPSLPKGHEPGTADERWRILEAEGAKRGALADNEAMRTMAAYRHNIENYIGTVKVPVGVAGPLRVNGMFAQGDYYVPLATTEATLVASYNRGMRAISRSGGCSTIIANEGVARAPGFEFDNLTDTALFVIWAMQHKKRIRYVAEKTTQFGKLINMSFNMEGNRVYFIFEFVTTDASGQNMATIASNAVYEWILLHTPIPPTHSFIESNLSGDKKASNQSFQTVRGRKVTAEARIRRAIVEKELHTTPEDMVRYVHFGTTASLLNGTIGAQGQYANGLAALYLACGQDVACVAESAVGVTRMEVTDEGDLHVFVTLPSLMVATVGGGTGLPSQSACLDILGLAGPGKVHQFAEVATAVCMAGELSLVGSICAQDFSRAHERFARGVDAGDEKEE